MVDLSQKNFFVIIISIIWGIGLVLLFKKSCPNDICYVYKVPDNYIENQPILTPQGWVRFVKYPTKCS
jgi:hypothetical protein